MRSWRLWSGRARFGLLLLAGALVLVAACDDDDDAAGPATGDGVTQDVQDDDDAGADDGGAAGSDEGPGGTGFAGEGLVEGAGSFDWDVRRVDRGTKPDIALDTDGTPLIAYMLERTGAAGFVRVAAASGDGFEVETLQNGYLYGPLDIEVSADGVAVVAYHQHDWQDAAVAVREGGVWDVQRVEHAGHDGWDDSVAFGPDGQIHLLSVDPAQFGGPEGIEYATGTDGAWSVQAVGAGPQPYEWGTDIAVDAAGGVHIVYFDAANGDLVYGELADGGWVLTTIFSDGDAGRFAVLALDAAGSPHVAFYQSADAVREEGRNGGSVVYGTLGAEGWEFQTIAELTDQVLGFEGARRTVAIALANGQPVVAFIDEARLGLAQLTDVGWIEETVIRAGSNPLQVVGLAVDAAGAPHLTFSTISGNGPLDGEVWYVAPVAKE